MPGNLMIAVAAAALLLFWAVGAYNRLVRLRAGVRAAFAALDARLVERLDWVGGMLASSAADPVGGGAAPDAPSWVRLAAAREQWAMALAVVRAQPADGEAVDRLALAHSVLETAWSSIPVQDWAQRVAMDATPVLAQWERLRQQEQPLTVAFNDAVRRHNAAIGQFPALVMARLCGFRPAQPLPLLEAGLP